MVSERGPINGQILLCIYKNVYQTKSINNLNTNCNKYTILLYEIGQKIKSQVHNILK